MRGLTHVDGGFLLLGLLLFAAASVFVSHTAKHATGLPTKPNQISSAPGGEAARLWNY
jgi:hypothetical protein